MNYRKDIDGLRAFAVIPVILYHAGVGLFSGGFIGVDIFFVISGYLITSLIISESNNNTFSIVTFYERRARRILPALFFVILVSSIFAYIFMLPFQLQEFGESVVSILFFISNFYFLSESGYFSTLAAEKPLLHTWTLSIEEQFYLLFPIAFLLLWNLSKKIFIFFISFVFFVSIFLAQFGGNLTFTYPYIEQSFYLTNVPSWAFYFTITRFWELIAGVLCAIVVSHGLSKKNEFLSFLGILFIFYSLLFYDQNTPTPSLYTILPVIGTSIIILFGEKSLVGNFLSFRIFVFIGLISYSAYLWHQPLFAFAKIILLDELDTIKIFLLIIGNLILAVLSWKFIEKPFREKNILNNDEFFISRSRLVYILLFTFSILLSISIYFIISDGSKDRYSLPINIQESLENPRPYEECFDSPENFFSEKCYIGNGNKNFSFLVTGDSHAQAIAPSINTAANKLGLAGTFLGYSGCVPLIDTHALRNDQSRKNCYQLNSKIFEYIKNNKIKNLFLIARWSYYTDGGYSGKNISLIGTNKNSKRMKSTSRDAFKLGLEKTIEKYNSIGTNVIIFTQIPMQKYNPKEIYYKIYEENITQEKIDSFSVSKNDHIKLQEFVENEFRKYSEEMSLINTTEIFCNEKCSVGNIDGSFYHDDDHLNLLGANKLLPVLEEKLGKINLNISPMH